MYRWYIRNDGGDMPSVVMRLWSKVALDEDEKCWEWLASKNNMGYGKLYWHGRLWLAHRVAYTLAYGEIPSDKILMHTCDNPGCVNPRHLRVGTFLDNARDMVTKGRKVTSDQRGESNPRAKLTNSQVLSIHRRLQLGETSTA